MDVKIVNRKVDGYPLLVIYWKMVTEPFFITKDNIDNEQKKMRKSKSKKKKIGRSPELNN